MNTHRGLGLSFVWIGLCMLLSACGQRQASDNEESGKVTRVAVAYALGGKGDLSYNDAAVIGVAALRRAGATVSEFEPATLDDYAKGLELLSVSKPKIIFCVGFLYDEQVARVAANHQSTLYVILDGSATNGANVCSVKFNAYEGSFLAGTVAGTLSKSRKIAFIGGADIPIINEFRKGYADGAKWVDGQVSCLSYFIGSGGLAFTDPVKGREMALTAIADGVDIIFHAAGSSGNGVIKAAKEKGIRAIGVDVDQNHLAPETVVTSMQKNFDTAMLYVLAKTRAGESLSGRNLVLGLSENAVGLAPIRIENAAALEKLTTKARNYLVGESSH